MTTSSPSPRRSDGRPSTSSEDWQSSYSKLKPAPLRLGPKDKVDAKKPPRVSEEALITFDSSPKTPGDGDTDSSVEHNVTLTDSKNVASPDHDPLPLGRHVETSPKSHFRFIEFIDQESSRKGVPESSSIYSLEANSTFTATVFPQHVDTSQKPEDGEKDVPRRQTAGLDWPLSTSTENWISLLERGQQTLDPRPQYDELEVELGGWSVDSGDVDFGHVAELRTHFESSKPNPMANPDFRDPPPSITFPKVNDAIEPKLPKSKSRYSRHAPVKTKSENVEVKGPEAKINIASEYNQAELLLSPTEFAGTSVPSQGFQRTRSSVADLRIIFKRSSQSGLLDDLVGSAELVKILTSNTCPDPALRIDQPGSLWKNWSLKSVNAPHKDGDGCTAKPEPTARLMKPIDPAPIPHPPFRMSAPPRVTLPKSKSSRSAQGQTLRRTKTEILARQSKGVDDADVFTTPGSHFDSSPFVAPKKANSNYSASSRKLHRMSLQPVDVTQTPRPAHDAEGLPQSSSPSLRRRDSKVSDLRRLFDKSDVGVLRLSPRHHAGTSESSISPKHTPKAPPTTRSIGRSSTKKTSPSQSSNRSIRHVGEHSNDSSWPETPKFSKPQDARPQSESPLKGRIRLFETISHSASSLEQFQLKARAQSHDERTAVLHNTRGDAASKTEHPVSHPNRSSRVWRRISRSWEPVPTRPPGPRPRKDRSGSSSDETKPALPPWGIRSLQKQKSVPFLPRWHGSGSREVGTSLDGVQEDCELVNKHVGQHKRAYGKLGAQEGKSAVSGARRRSWSWGRRKTSQSDSESGDMSCALQVDVAVAKVQCNLQHPKPVRGSEMKRLVSLCKNRVGALYLGGGTRRSE